MTHRLINALKLHAESMDGQQGRAKAGKITSVGPDGTTVKIAFLDDPNQTPIGWLPVGQMGVGNNAIIAPPNIGDVVMLESHEGDAENWFVTHRLFTTSAPPPNSPATSAPVKPGELAVVVNGGGYIHFMNSGTVQVGGTDIILAGSTVAINAGTIDLSGTVAVTGTLTVSGPIVNHGTTLAVP